MKQVKSSYTKLPGNTNMRLLSKKELKLITGGEGTPCGPTGQACTTCCVHGRCKLC